MVQTYQGCLKNDPVLSFFVPRIWGCWVLVHAVAWAKSICPQRREALKKRPWPLWSHFWGTWFLHYARQGAKRNSNLGDFSEWVIKPQFKVMNSGVSFFFCLWKFNFIPQQSCYWSAERSIRWSLQLGKNGVSRLPMKRCPGWRVEVRKNHLRKSWTCAPLKPLASWINVWKVIWSSQLRTYRYIEYYRIINHM